MAAQVAALLVVAEVQRHLHSFRLAAQKAALLQARDVVQCHPQHFLLQWRRLAAQAVALLAVAAAVRFHPHRLRWVVLEVVR